MTQDSTLHRKDQEATVSSLGGTVTRWGVNGNIIIYPQHRVGDKIRGGMHQCFPNFGKVADSFSLPQHGRLRDLEMGLMKGHKTKWESEVTTRLESRELFGKENLVCAVETGTTLFSSAGGAPSLRYVLSAYLKSGPKEHAWVNPGFHPYFYAPRGEALIRYGKETFRWSWERRTNPKFIPSKRETRKGPVSIEILGLCTVEMELDYEFLGKPTTGVVIWSDSCNYVCVEPVLGTPGKYGQKGCQRLLRTRALDFGCTLRVTNM